MYYSQTYEFVQKIRNPLINSKFSYVPLLDVKYKKKLLKRHIFHKI